MGSENDLDWTEGELIRTAAADAWELLCRMTKSAASKFVRSGNRLYRVEVRIVDFVPSDDPANDEGADADVAMLLSRHMDLMNQFGVNSFEEKAFVAQNSDNEKFVRLATMARRLKIALSRKLT